MASQAKEFTLQPRLKLGKIGEERLATLNHHQLAVGLHEVLGVFLPFPQLAQEQWTKQLQLRFSMIAADSLAKNG